MFVEWLDLGTTLALLIYFRKKIWQILVDVFKNHNYKLALNVVITAIPAGIVGLALSKLIDNSSFFSNLFVVAISLIVVGIVMVILERLPRKSEVASLEKLSYKRALGIGLVQILALIPGVSRSGSTIIAGRLLGFNPEHAAEYSFLVSIPIMLGLSLKLFVGNHSYLAAHSGPILISNVAAFIFGLIAISFMLRYLANHKLLAFGWYRIVLGLAAITVGLLVGA